MEILKNSQRMTTDLEIHTIYFVIRSFTAKSISDFYRDGARSVNLGGQVVMRRAAAAARRHFLFCLNLGGMRPPAPPTPDSAIPA